MTGEGSTRVDEALIEKWALDYLGRYASSAANLRRVLMRRARRRVSEGAELAGEAAAIIDVLVARYHSAGLVDDVAYAAAQARSGLRRGQSLRRVRAKLVAKGVGTEAASRGIEAAVGLPEGDVVDPDLAAACAFARRRRFGPFRSGPADEEARSKELAAFGRAGFERATAEAVLACTDPDAVQALLAGDEP